MSRRPLSPEERALWGRVVGTVRPLHGKALSPISKPITERTWSEFVPVKQAVQPSTLPKPTRATATRQISNTLDGSWDKRIAGGVISPDYTIDLHGETLSSAHAHLNRSLAAALRDEARVILLITGRPAKGNPRLPPTSRGVIRASVGDWLAASPHAGKIAAVRNAHPRHGGAGALYLILRRAR